MVLTMSYEDPQEDVDNCARDATDEYGYYFNMCQGGGVVVYKEEGVYNFYEIPLYGGKEMYYRTVTKENLLEAVKEAYTFT